MSRLPKQLSTKTGEAQTAARQHRGRHRPAGTARSPTSATYCPQPAYLPDISEDWSGSPPLAEPSTAYGQAKRTYLHQTDLAHWLFTLLEHGHPGQAYNVGSDEVISIAALAHLVRDLLAPDKPVHIQSKADIGAARNRYVPDICKAKQQLGLGVTVPLADAIRRMSVLG